MITQATRAYFERMFPGQDPTFLETDPEFSEIFSNFTLDEVAGNSQIDEKTRFIAILATLIGSGSIDAYNYLLPAALNFDVTPEEVKEIVYQGVVYLGIGRVFPFLKATNSVFDKLGIKMPLKKQSTTTPLSRLEDGIEKQVEIFGEEKRDFHKSGEKTREQVNFWVTEYAFGEFYTREGLPVKLREMVTFCFLLAQGGCETQLMTHIKGNFHVGNDEAFLGAVLKQVLPYIGFPRTLNAITCLEKAARE